MTYTKFIDFGKKLNDSIKNPENAANPLTYCMFPTLNSQFFHGSLSGGLLYTNQNANCLNYMADRCSEKWDDYCEAFMDLNKDSYQPNTAAIDPTAYLNAKNFLGIQTTVGQDLLRNSSYRKFICVPNITAHIEPFDYSVANSPKFYNYSSYVTGYSQLKNLDNKYQVNNDPLVQKMLAHPRFCLDVIGRIYLGYIKKEVNLDDTIFIPFFENNRHLLNQYIKQAIIYVPSFQQKNREMYYPPCAHCHHR
jgi:hypothetical protein